MHDRPTLPPEDDDREAETGSSAPIFNLPRSLLVTLVLLAAIYAVWAYLLGEDMQAYVVVHFGFTPLRYVYPLAGQGLEWLWTPVTYSLLHGSIEHIGFNALWLAAFGAPVVRRIGALDISCSGSSLRRHRLSFTLPCIGATRRCLLARQASSQRSWGRPAASHSRLSVAMIASPATCIRASRSWPLFETAPW